MITDYAEKRFLEGQKIVPRPEKKVAVVDAYNDPDLLRARINLVERKRNEILIRAAEDVMCLDLTLEQLKTKLAQYNMKVLH